MENWRVSIWISGNRFPESYYFNSKRKAVWFFDQHATAYDVNHIELAKRYPNACFGFERISLASN